MKEYSREHLIANVIKAKMHQIKEEEQCLLDAFFERQKSKPDSLRSSGAYISCPCSKCNRASL